MKTNSQKTASQTKTTIANGYSTREQIEAMTPEERKTALNDCLQLTAETLKRAATIFSVMEAKGEAHDIPNSVARTLRRINDGLLFPEVVTTFEGSIRNKIGKLPPDKQKQLLLPNATVPLVEGNRIKHIAATALNPQQAAQVFANQAIRSPQEQRVWLESKSKAKTTTRLQSIQKAPNASVSIPGIIKGVCKGNQDGSYFVTIRIRDKHPLLTHNKKVTIDVSV
jgi:hypothetical protein